VARGRAPASVRWPIVSAPAVRARFAPSPTGFLHLGSARTALFNWLTARHHGGELLLRIEDTDAERSKPELIDLIFRTLGWLGIDWDGHVVHQSQRADLYRDAVDRLLASGQAYWCACTPDEVKARADARGGKPGYDGHCRDRGLGPGPGHVVRFRIPDDGDTVIDDEGASVSAGERQLITIARAFLADPTILILDEATSSVDTRTEVLIQRAMAALRSNRTSFVIAHRLSTIRDAHTILVMEHGQIVEQGSHDELIARNGAYARLYNAQFAAPAVEVA